MSNSYITCKYHKRDKFNNFVFIIAKEYDKKSFNTIEKYYNQPNKPYVNNPIYKKVNNKTDHCYFITCKNLLDFPLKLSKYEIYSFKVSFKTRENKKYFNIFISSKPKMLKSDFEDYTL